MATIVNNPPPSDSSGGIVGVVLVLVVVLVLGYLAYVYGLPAIRQTQVAPQINVPSTIDVNVNETE